MNTRSFSLAVSVAALLAQSTAHARLGETEQQSQARYGEPTPQSISPLDKPLMPGAKEVIYTYQGWRVRAAFVNNATVRIEYVHVPEGALPKPLTDEEVKGILDAEKATYSWREQKPKTGNKDLNALKTFFDGKSWERGDHATASLKASLVLTLESRDADALEKKLAKQAAAAGPVAKPAAPLLPKF